MRVPPNHPLNNGFSTNHPAMGVPPFMETPINESEHHPGTAAKLYLGDPLSKCCWGEKDGKIQ